MNISFAIGGKQFPINPFDIAQPNGPTAADDCSYRLAESDTPLACEFFYVVNIAFTG